MRGISQGVFPQLLFVFGHGWVIVQYLHLVACSERSVLGWSIGGFGVSCTLGALRCAGLRSMSTWWPGFAWGHQRGIRILAFETGLSQHCMLASHGPCCRVGGGPCRLIPGWLTCRRWGALRSLGPWLDLGPGIDGCSWSHRACRCGPPGPLHCSC